MTEAIIFTLAVTPGGHLLAGESDNLYTSTQTISASNPTSKTEAFVEDGPALFSLGQNYPNPFNPTTMISFSLRTEALVTLKVYNTLGQEVAELLRNESMDEGEQEVEFDASSLSSGVYYYRIVAGDMNGKGMLYSNTRKMLMLK